MKSEFIKMTPGLRAIAKERNKQIDKLKYTLDKDIEINNNEQLIEAAHYLLHKPGLTFTKCPKGWDIKRWNKMLSKSIKERITIAGALLAAELDRLDKLEE